MKISLKYSFVTHLLMCVTWWLTYTSTFRERWIVYLFKCETGLFIFLTWSLIVYVYHIMFWPDVCTGKKGEDVHILIYTYMYMDAFILDAFILTDPWIWWYDTPIHMYFTDAFIHTCDVMVHVYIPNTDIFRRTCNFVTRHIHLFIHQYFCDVVIRMCVTWWFMNTFLLRTWHIRWLTHSSAW